MTVSQLSQDLTGDWSSAAVMETDLAGCRGGLQRRDTHLTRNSRSGTGCETRAWVGEGVGDGSRSSQTRPDVYLSVPTELLTSSPSCTYSASCRGLSPQCLTDRPRLRREDRSGGQAARSGQAREGAASDADVAGNAKESRPVTSPECPSATRPLAGIVAQHGMANKRYRATPRLAEK